MSSPDELLGHLVDRLKGCARPLVLIGSTTANRRWRAHRRPCPRARSTRKGIGSRAPRQRTRGAWTYPTANGWLLEETTERLPLGCEERSDQGPDQGLHGRDGSVAATRFRQGQSTDGGQHEQQRRRHRHFKGDGGAL